MHDTERTDRPTELSSADADAVVSRRDPQPNTQLLPREIGGRKGPEPTRYGDWEKNGRCIDF